MSLLLKAQQIAELNAKLKEELSRRADNPRVDDEANKLSGKLKAMAAALIKADPSMSAAVGRKSWS